MQFHIPSRYIYSKTRSGIVISWNNNTSYVTQNYLTNIIHGCGFIYLSFREKRIFLPSLNTINPTGTSPLISSLTPITACSITSGCREMAYGKAALLIRESHEIKGGQNKAIQISVHSFIYLFKARRGYHS